MNAAHVLHDLLVLDLKLLKVLGERVETVTDVLVVSVTSYITLDKRLLD